jgi:membrane-bound serine protease (ClpP class)
MNKLCGFVWRVAALVLIGLALVPRAAAQTGAHVDVLTVVGALDTWTDSYVRRGIGLAERDGAEALVIVLDTPGGTLGATQHITTRILNARVPVVVFVYPSGAWAASAGTFVTLAAHIAAMAPGTTIGAAHPVALGGENLPSDESTKATEFSVALIRSIAEQRGRNADWAAAAVRQSLAATPQQALDAGAIDLIAKDLNDLLNQMDGRTVATAAGEITLRTRRAGSVAIAMNPAERVLHTLVDPNIAIILLLVGMVAIAVEMFHPGAILPAATGGICLILAFVALGNLPVNWGGALMVAASVVLFVLDIKVQGYALSVAGLVMFVLGALLLFTPFTAPSPLLPRVSVSPAVIAVAAGAMGAFFVFVLGAAVRGRRYPVLSGTQALVGAVGSAATDLSPHGQVQVRGELWTALAQDGPIPKGEAVRVVGVEGLRLKVVRGQPPHGESI